MKSSTDKCIQEQIKAFLGVDSNRQIPSINKTYMVYTVPVIGMAALQMHACKARVLHARYTQCPHKCPKICVITRIYKEFNNLLLRL